MASDRREQQTRRRFLRTGILAALGVTGVGGFATAFSGFLRSGQNRQLFAVPEFKFCRPAGEERPQPVLFGVPDRIGGFYIASYPPEALPKARKVYSKSVVQGMEQGVVALSRRCTHRGDNIAWCASAQWFECPSHGAQFNAVGERKGGPAPRGLDHFMINATGPDTYEVDRGSKAIGAPDSTDTTGQKAEGPHCV